MNNKRGLVFETYVALLGVGSLVIMILEQRLVKGAVPIGAASFFFVLTMVAWFYSVSLSSHYELHLGTASYFAALLTLGALPATVIAALSTLIFLYLLYLTQPRLSLAAVSGPLPPPSAQAQVPLGVFRDQVLSKLLRRRIPHLRIAANVCVAVLSTGVAGLVWGALASPLSVSVASRGLMAEATTFAVFSVSATCMNLVNVILSCLGVQMDYGIPFVVVWRKWARSLLLSCVILAPLGFLVAFLLRWQPLALLLLLPTFVATHYATQQQAGILTETEKTIVFLAKVLESRDKYTFDHSKKVGTYARGIALAMGLGEEKGAEIEKAAWMHDIGKIAVEDSVLHKDGRLTSGEVAHMMQHISVLPELFEHRQFLSKYWGAFFHHERYDGTGYMHGLKEEEIPLEGRIIAIADVYDALTSDRPYRKGLPKDEALEIIRKGRGTHFDPGIVDVFLTCVETDS